MSARSGSSAASDADDALSDDAEEEHRLVSRLLRDEDDAERAKRVRHKQGTRAITVLDDTWGSILAAAVQTLLASMRHASG